MSQSNEVVQSLRHECPLGVASSFLGNDFEKTVSKFDVKFGKNLKKELDARPIASIKVIIKLYQRFKNQYPEYFRT